jgi:hypothetical protein
VAKTKITIAVVERGPKTTRVSKRSGGCDCRRLK